MSSSRYFNWTTSSSAPARHPLRKQLSLDSRLNNTSSSNISFKPLSASSATSNTSNNSTFNLVIRNNYNNINNSNNTSDSNNSALINNKSVKKMERKILTRQMSLDTSRTWSNRALAASNESMKIMPAVKKRPPASNVKNEYAMTHKTYPMSNVNFMNFYLFLKGLSLMKS